MFRTDPVALVVLSCAVAVAGCSGPAPSVSGEAAADVPQGLEAAETVIDESGLLAAIEQLSADEFEGRGPGSAGDRKARSWIVERMRAIGCEPAGPDGGFEQSIPIVGLTARMPEAWAFRSDSGSTSFRWWDEYIAASGVQSPRVSIEDAEVVFVGYGIEAPEEDWDDFEGQDVRGKVLLMLNDDPDWDPELFAGPRRLYYGRWTYKYEMAARKGAVAAILIHTDRSAGYGWNVVQTSWTGPQFESPAADEPRVLASAWLTEEAARRLTALAGRDLDDLVAAARTREFEPVPLGVRTSLSFEVDVERTETANVLGRLRGSERPDEVVVYTAHHDHLGVGEPDAEGDRIYNGAVDNASGVAQMLSIAEAFASLSRRPRRSVMFLAVAAEEQGLLGSRFFARHPTVPPGRMVANLNLDGGNIRGRTEDVAVIGRGKSDLEDLLQRFAARQGREIVDEPDPDKGYYYRSDQFNLARIGVPALYFKSGNRYRGRPDDWGRRVNDDWRREVYHQPSDEVSPDWDLSGMVEDARLALAVGLAVADGEDWPRWRPGDEFEAARERALRAAASH